MFNPSDYRLYTYVDDPRYVVLYHFGTYAIGTPDVVGLMIPLTPNYSTRSLTSIGAGEFLGTLDTFPELLL